MLALRQYKYLSFFLYSFYPEGGDMYPECYQQTWESHHQTPVTWERSAVEQTTVSPSPAGTVDQELSRDMMSRDVTLRDSETDFTLDSEQSTTEEFISSPIRADTESPEPSGFRFERTGPFYKSTRFRDTSDDMFRDYQDPVSPAVDHIPEKYFVTVSGFEDTAPGDSVHVSSAQTPKPRNVTEV